MVGDILLRGVRMSSSMDLSCWTLCSAAVLLKEAKHAW